MKKLLPLILTFLCFTSVSLAQDIYVNINATGSANNGTSWTDAYTDLQDAIDAATINQEIWVAAGTYLPNKDHLGNSTPAENRNKNFHIGTDMKIYGGFDGTETLLSERDWKTNVTILSGDIGTAGVNTDNSYHVLITTGLSSAAAIDGFTVRDGNANGGGAITFGSDFYKGLGGGMSNINSSPSATNMSFVYNASYNGGGMYNNSASPSMVNVTFASNTANNAGGGMFNESSYPKLTNVTFTTNMANFGGGMFNYVSSSSSVTNCIFWANKKGTSTTTAGADIENISSAPVVTYTSLQNYAGGTGAINGDPLFVDAANGDFSLQACSPVINMGTAVSHTTDILGNPHFGTVDMGAYEYQGNPFSGTAIYVKKDAAGTNDGSSWANAYTDLQDAIDNQCNGLDIWVAAGTYYPSSSPDEISTDPRDKSFHIATDMKIYGGFNGTETALFQRDWKANVTILNGDLENTTDSSFHVLITANLTNASLIDGFIIKNGNAITDKESMAYLSLLFARKTGGGMYNISSSPTICNTTFINNNARNGGGITNQGALSPIIKNTTFEKNNATYKGGGIFNVNSLPSITNATFIRNSALTGGAINNNGSSPKIVNTTFTENVASQEGGALYNYYSSSPTITNSIFWKNTKNNNNATPGADIYNQTSTDSPVFSYSLTQENSLYSNGTGIINNQDPLFIDAANGDFRLMACSPAINVGTTVSHTTDILGNNHFGIVDMGAYEYQGNPFSGTAIYVKKDAAGANDGSSWANAYSDLQDAIDNQCNGLDIWVAAGTYLPTASPDDISTDPRDKSFHIGTDMKIYGGFDGTETALSQRDWESNVTILSGDFDGNDVVTGAGSSLSFTNNEENAIHVLITADLTTSSIIDGFTISKGNANVSPGAITYQSKSFFGSLGGGLYNFTSSPFITNTTFVNNNTDFHGGAMSNYGSSPSITNSVFANNNADRNGGGIYNEFSSPAITNTTFVNNNAALKGGGIYNIQFSPTIANTIFWENTQLGGNAVAGADISDNGSATNATYSLTQENSDFSTGTGIINNEDPLFVDAANGDFRLMACSPAIDKGTPDTIGLNLGLIDLAGIPRVLNNRIDMGAYEGASAGLATATDSLTWTGAVDTVWNNACNWSPAGIPTATNDVIIPSGPVNQPTLSINNAVAKSIHVQNGATFTIAPLGQLSINNFKNFVTSEINENASFFNQGTVENYGLIQLGNLNTIGRLGIINTNIFNNKTAAKISIDNTLDNSFNLTFSIYNLGGTFTNSAELTLGAIGSGGDYGIFNDSYLTNSMFINNLGGVLSIDNINSGGISGGIYNATDGTFTNEAKLNIGFSGSAGSVAIENNGGTFSNNVNGIITLDNSTFYGINNFNGTFINSAILNIGENGPVGLRGLVNDDNFINNPLGEISINNFTETGLLNFGTFTNNTKITTGTNVPMGKNCISNYSTFINTGCAEIKILKGNFSNYSFNGTMGLASNLGYIFITDSLKNDGAFTNNGILKYGVQTGNPVVNSTSSSIIVNNTLSTIFSYGGTYNGTVNGIFTDEAATIPAGSFTTPNSFVPLSTLPLGSQTLYVKVTPNGGACSHVVPFLFDNFREIDVRGNYVSIANADMTPSASDLTDFGVAGINGGTISHIFTIVNEGTSTLTLGANPISKSGPHEADFTILQPSETTIAPGDSVYFDIIFDPSVLGERNATISIANDDANENPYTFAILGNSFCNVPSTASISGTDSLNCTQNTVTRTASGGESYAWSNGLGTSPTVNITNTGTYTVTVTAANGCSSTATTEVVFNNNLVVSASNDGPYEEQETINLMATGGPSYSWTGPDGFTSSLVNPSITNASSAKAGIYTVTVNNGSCTSTATTDVIINCSTPGMSYYLAYVDGAEVDIFTPLVSEMEVQATNRRMTVLAIPNCELPLIESTRLQLSGTGNIQFYNDNEASYSLYENNGATYGDVFEANYYTFIARGYAQDNSQGVVVGPDVIRFWVVRGDREFTSPTLSTNVICAGASFTVSSTVTGASSFNVGNMYQAFLSDENGSFTNQILIGSSANPSNIACTIPSNLTGGSNYKVIVRSSSPIVSSDASASLSITSNSLSLLSPTNDILSGTQTEQAIQSINAENKISGSSNVMYKAGNAILLAPGFSTVSGNVFSAKIEDVCAE